MTAAGPVAHPAWRVTRRASSRTLGDMGRRSGRLVRCNGTNVDGSRCGNEFRTESWRTKCHVHRFSGERGWLARKLEERRGSAGPGAVSSMPDPSDGSIADDDWRRETRRRARQLVGGRRWNEFEARATVQNCRQLADVADALSRVRAGVRQLTTDVIDHILPAGPRLVRDLVAACARAYVVEQLGGTRELATALLIMGVLSCAAQDTDLVAARAGWQRPVTRARTLPGCCDAPCLNWRPSRRDSSGFGSVADVNAGATIRMAPLEPGSEHRVRWARGGRAVRR